MERWHHAFLTSQTTERGKIGSVSTKGCTKDPVFFVWKARETMAERNPGRGVFGIGREEREGEP
jgi:hypothetical protein